MAFTLTSFGGMPMEMQQLLQEKYRQSGQVSAAQANQMNAQARLDAQRATVVQPLAQSQIGLEKTQGMLNTANTAYRNKETERYDDVVDADIAYKRAGANNLNADAGFTGLRSQWLPRMNTMLLENSKSENAYRDTQTRLMPGETRARIDYMGSQGANLDADTFNRRLILPTDIYGIPQLKRGTARVPGKGSGDIQPAMLEPGEAVLNKHAAGMMGRDKIAKLNAKGNQKRAKQEGGKIAALLKQMGMA